MEVLLSVSLALATAIIYSNSFSVPFVFDDISSIRENHTIRDLTSVRRVLSPPHDGGTTVGGRPILNLSFAINHALHGGSVTGYHILNLALHYVNGLLLFGIVRRTLRHNQIEPFAASSKTLAAATALLWLVHPLQTESVTYLSQRAESLGALFYFLALYLFIRGVESSSRKWFVATVAACVLGMASKETVATAPLTIILFDAVMIAGSFRRAWSDRRLFYSALVATWLVPGALLIYFGANRGGSAGFGQSVETWPYALAQAEGILHYLRLGLWPSPLVFDYGEQLRLSLGEVWPELLLIIIAFGVGLYKSVVRKSKLGFLVTVFFVIISPSSSIIPIITQTWAEHRMYMPLACEILAVVVGLSLILSRPAFSVATAAIALCFGALTFQRNSDYRSLTSLWTDTVLKSPLNPRAHLGLGSALFDENKVSDAVASLREALRLDPHYARAHAALGTALLSSGAFDEALKHASKAVTLVPGNAYFHRNLGDLLRRMGRLTEAAAEYELAIGLNPQDAQAYASLGTTLFLMGRSAESISHFENAVRLDPDALEPRINFATALAVDHQFSRAVEQYILVLKRDPKDPDVHYLLATALLRLGKTESARTEILACLNIDRDHRDALETLRFIDSGAASDVKSKDAPGIR